MIEITLLIGDNCETIGYVAKGSHSKDEMEKAILKQYGEDDLNISHIDTHYCRWIPSQKGTPSKYLEPSDKGRGAFMATVVWLK